MIRRRYPDELVADLARYYHIFDFTQHPPGLVATLTEQLPDDSRVKRKLAGLGCSRLEFLTALAVDRLSLLVWAQTKDGQKGRNRPKSIALALLGGDAEEQGAEIFASPEDFEETRAALIAQAQNGGDQHAELHHHQREAEL